MDQFFEVVEDLAAHTDGGSKAIGIYRLDHEFLEGDRRIGVRTAVDDVHHRNGQYLGVYIPYIAVQRQTEFVGSGFGYRQRYTEDGVGTQFAFVFGAVQSDHRFVDAYLVEHVAADEFRSDLFVYVGNGFQDTFAHVFALVAVAKFDSLVFTGGCSRGNDGAAHGAVFGVHFHFDGRVAPRVEDLSGMDFCDQAHFL